MVECLDGLARITSKELAITHFVKSGTLQNACSTRPRVVVGLGESALMRIVRLMNYQVKGPKRMMTKEDHGQSWSSQEWKSGAAEPDRSGKPEKTSWDMLQQVAPHREEPLLGRNAHSARYGELIHDRPGKPGEKSDKKLGQNSSKRPSSDARQLGCVFQDMKPPKSFLPKSSDTQKPIQRVKFTKAIARHTKIRDPKSFARIHLPRGTS